MPAAEALARGLLTATAASGLKDAAEKIAEGLAARSPAAYSAYAANKAWLARPMKAALVAAQAAADDHKVQQR